MRIDAAQFLRVVYKLGHRDERVAWTLLMMAMKESENEDRSASSSGEVQ